MSGNGKIVTEIVKVTPDQAKAWFDSKGANRKVSTGTVLNMARDMVAGRWLLTHQGIAFDEGSHLLDGQHRLAAVMMAGVPVEMMVSRNVPHDRQIVMDDHRRRTGADVLTINSGGAQQVEIMTVAILSFFNSVIGAGKFSKSELADAYERYGTAAMFAADAVKTHVRGVTVAPVLAPVARAWFGHDRNRLLDYVNVLQTGTPLTVPDDNAALQMRNWLLANRECRARGTRADMFARSQNALRYFLDRTEPKLLKASREDLFPIPEVLALPRSIATAQRKVV